MKRLFVPDDVASPLFGKDKNIRLLQYAHTATTENFDAFLTHHALVYILSGVKQINISHCDFRINTGELFLIPKGEYVMSEYIAGERGFQSMMLFFNQRVAHHLVFQLKESFAEIPILPSNKEAVKIIPHTPAIQALFHSLADYSQQKTSYFCEIIRLKFMELIYLLLDSPHRKTILSFLMEAARYENPSLASVLEQHLYSCRTVAELAKISGRSLSGFKREFLQQYGEAPMTWIRKKKLERAAFLLETSNENIENIAETSGFISASHFTRVFKEYYSVTPRDYRTK